MSERTPQTNDGNGRTLQILFIALVILFWEAFKSLVAVITLWSMGLEFGSHLTNMLLSGFNGLVAFLIIRFARHPSKEIRSQNP